VLLVAVVLIFLARQRIWTQSGLEAVCEEKTRAYFVAKGDAPTDWRPLMLSELGSSWSLYASWRVGTKHYKVMCSGKIGKSISGVGYEVGEPE
jgi:hypothetical protein